MTQRSVQNLVRQGWNGLAFVFLAIFVCAAVNAAPPEPEDYGFHPTRDPDWRPAYWSACEAFDQNEWRTENLNHNGAAWQGKVAWIDNWGENPHRYYVGSLIDASPLGSTNSMVTQWTDPASNTNYCVLKAEDLDRWRSDIFWKYRVGHMQSKKQYRYGYFEIKAKVPPSHVVSGFWLRTSDRDTVTSLEPDNDGGAELDILEAAGANTTIYNQPPQQGGDGSRVHFNAHLGNGDWIFSRDEPTYSYNINQAVRVDSKLHTFGLLWTKDRIVWYVDGVPIQRLNNWYSDDGIDVNDGFHDFMNIILDREFHYNWIRPGPGNIPFNLHPEPAQYSISDLGYQIDHIVVFQRIDARDGEMLIRLDRNR